MKTKELKKLLKEFSPSDIIRMYCMNKIYLYPFQLNKVLKLCGEKKYGRYDLKLEKKYGIRRD